MPVEIQWDDDSHTILRLDIHGQASWDEYHQKIDEIVEQLADSPHRVDLIMNIMSNMPPGQPISHLERAVRRFNTSPALRYTATVLNGHRVSSFTEIIVYAVLRLNRVDMSRNAGFYSTLDEARAALARKREADSTLDTRMA